MQGDPGEGKTHLILAIASMLTKGENLPNSSEHPPMSVIYQTAEDGLADNIKPRLEMIGADCSKILVIDETNDVLSLSDERIHQAIIETNAKFFSLFFLALFSCSCS